MKQRRKRGHWTAEAKLWVSDHMYFFFLAYTVLTFSTLIQPWTNKAKWKAEEPSTKRQNSLIQSSNGILIAWTSGNCYDKLKRTVQLHVPQWDICWSSVELALRYRSFLWSLSWGVQELAYGCLPGLWPAISVSISLLVWSYLIYNLWNKISGRSFVDYEKEQWRNVPQVLARLSLVHCMACVCFLFCFVVFFFPSLGLSYHELHRCVFRMELWMGAN